MINDNHLVGVDMGGTKILSAVVTGEGKVLSQFKMQTRADRRPDEVIQRIADCIRKAIDASGLHISQVRAIGVGAPGPLDPDTGVVIFAPNLGWSNVPLKAKLEARLGIPTFVDNDVNVGTLGEFVFGAGKGTNNLVGVFVGTGIGGGIIWEGKLLHGVNKTAGEIGHMIVKAGGPRCGCGNRGCLEALASRTAITKQFRKAILKKGKKSLIVELNGGNLKTIRSNALAEAIDRRDKLATKIMRRAAEYLGIGVASIVHFLNPEMIVFGGGVVESMGDSFVEDIRNIAAAHALPNTLSGVQIVKAKLGDHAGVIGASVLARQRLSEEGRELGVGSRLII
jgi:glucokinase